ncbi:unnamed protein product [Calicophoron daubneyi]|uniref:Uncharacterized protein n=1 Tax=Calicophoron daubneyi TaxID=300641 RepID=A0AAV2TL12_CALDB
MSLTRKPPRPRPSQLSCFSSQPSAQGLSPPGSDSRYGNSPPEHESSAQVNYSGSAGLNAACAELDQDPADGDDAYGGVMRSSDSFPDCQTYSDETICPRGKTYDWISESLKGNCLPLPTFHVSQEADLTVQNLNQPRFLDPSQDILAQWRLRRKMEEAQLAAIGSITYPDHHLKIVGNPKRVSALRGPLTVRSAFNTYTPQVTHFTQDRTVTCDTRNTGVQCDYIPPCARFIAETSSQMEFSKSLEDMFDETPQRRDIGTMTNGIRTQSVQTQCFPQRPEHRSMRVMVQPHTREFGSQANLGRDAVRIEVSAEPVGCTNRPHNSLIAAITDQKPELQRSLLFPFTASNPNDSESVPVTEIDSWHWPSTTTLHSDNDSPKSSAPHPPTEACSVVDGCCTCSGEISQVRSSQCEKNCGQNPTDATWLANDVHTNTLSIIGDSYLNSSIARYLEQSGDASESTLGWNEDPIVQDLLNRRSVCLQNMRQVVEEIHNLELRLLKNADKKRDENRSPCSV